MSNNEKETNVMQWFWMLLTVLFIALKLTGYIDWHWAWIFAPIWIPFLVTVFMVVSVVLVLRKRK
jgi:hypothetical protein